MFRGCLDFIDRIEDDFYDPGAIKAGTRVKTLEEFGVEEVNNKRPVFLINLKPPLGDVYMIFY